MMHGGSVDFIPMNTIDDVLDSNRFLRIHRSYIGNIRRIAQLWSIAHGQYAVELKLGYVYNRGAPPTSASAARLQIDSDCIEDFHGGTSASRECAKVLLRASSQRLINSLPGLRGRTISKSPYFFMRGLDMRLLSR